MTSLLVVGGEGERIPTWFPMSRRGGRPPLRRRRRRRDDAIVFSAALLSFVTEKTFAFPLSSVDRSTIAHKTPTCRGDVLLARRNLFRTSNDENDIETAAARGSSISSSETPANRLSRPWTLAGIPGQLSSAAASRSSSTRKGEGPFQTARERYEPRDMPRSAPTLLGLLFTTALVYGLVLQPEEVRIGNDGVEIVTEAADKSFKVAEAVVGEALPNSIPDALAVALSEGVAGAFSSLVLFVSSVAFNAGRKAAMRVFMASSSSSTDATTAPLSPRSTLAPSATFSSPSSVTDAFQDEGRDVESLDSMDNIDDDLSEAVATADFFYAKSAVTATLEASQVPLAPVLGVVLAQIPYQLAKGRNRLDSGEGLRPSQMLDSGSGKKPRPSPSSWIQRLRARPVGKETQKLRVNRANWSDSLRIDTGAQGALRERFRGRAQERLRNGKDRNDEDEVVDGTRDIMKRGAVNFMGIDGVDAVADLIKWLEYDVLVADFADFSYDFLQPSQVEALTGVTSAFFGAVAALSSQIYRDATLSFGYGTEPARRELKSRDVSGWVITYARTIASSAILFGGYETIRKPLTTLALEYFSGGAQACYGSVEYDQCIDIYLLDALPSALIQSLVG